MSNILVVKNADFDKSKFEFTNEGLLLNTGDDGVLDTITEKAFWYDRDLAENNFNLRQIIVYTALVSLRIGGVKGREENKIFFYRRTQKHDEKRLRNKWSIGLGGHISQEEDGTVDPIFLSIKRELQEEVGINFPRDLYNPVGFLYSEEKNVDSVHLGILNFVDYHWSEITPVDKEIAEGKMMTLQEINKILVNPENELETWSKIALAHIEHQICFWE